MATSLDRWSFSAYIVSTCCRTSWLGWWFCMLLIRNSSSSWRTNMACFCENETPFISQRRNLCMRSTCFIQRCTTRNTSSIMITAANIFFFLSKWDNTKKGNRSTTTTKKRAATISTSIAIRNVHWMCHENGHLGGSAWAAFLYCSIWDELLAFRRLLLYSLLLHYTKKRARERTIEAANIVYWSSCGTVLCAQTHKRGIRSPKPHSSLFFLSFLTFVSLSLSHFRCKTKSNDIGVANGGPTLPKQRLQFQSGWVERDGKA